MNIPTGKQGGQTIMTMAAKTITNLHNKKIPSSLRHYTTLEAFKEMLQPWLNSDDDGVAPFLNFHASLFSKMNDANEGKIIYDRFFTESIRKQAYKEKYDEFLNGRRQYIISLTRSTLSLDILPMWFTYADGAKGIYLRFNGRELLDWAKSENDCELDSCFYMKSKNIANTIQKLNLTVPKQGQSIGYFFRKLTYEAVLSKNQCWEYEDEWRIVKLETNNNAKQKATNRGLVEYIDIHLPLDALAEVRIGPKANKEWVRKSLDFLLCKIKAKCGQCNIKVTESIIKLQ